MPLAVVSFAREHLDAAAVLLAARHRADRARHPLLPIAFESPDNCRAILEAAMGYAQGVAALESPSEAATGSEDQRLVGFAFVVLNFRAGDSPSARYGPSRSSMIFAHGHAVAEDVDPTAVYAALFAPIAERAAHRGVFDHLAHVPAGDRAVEDAWSNLGFGRTAAVAARDLAPLTRPLPAEVEVRQATSEDLDVVDDLVDEESRYHARSPILRPYVRADIAPAVHDQLATTLAAADHAILIARLDGHDVGVISVEPNHGSPLFTPEGAAYIGDTAVLPAARSRGVGAALVNAALAWARAHDYEAATLHFATANPLSTPFWTGLGFRPVMWHMHRHIDDRITWALAPSG